MPINDNHTVIKPPKENITLWRYMDIPSFIYLLAKESLTFVRADLFEDKYEGTLPKLSANVIDKWARNEIQNGKLHKGYWNLSRIFNEDKKTTYLNCWCKENYEMVHMWKIYSKENGIAIQTTYEKLKKAVISKEQVYPTEITYMDFQKELINDHNNGMTVFTVKRQEYKSENEFRLIMSHPRILEDQLFHLKTHDEIESVRKAIYSATPIIHCDIKPNELITNIHLSPYAPKWYLEIVEDLIIKYNLTNINLTQSNL